MGQWRAYADNGRGFALAFDRQELESAFIREVRSPFAQTFPLTYDAAQLSSLQQQIAQKASEIIASPHDWPSAFLGGTEGLRLVSSVSFITHALHAALFFKHPAYRNEQEYRFLEMFPAGTEPTEVKTRTRPYSLVKYRELDWRRLAPDSLRKVVVGPGADHEKADQSAGDCLRSFHNQEIEIVRSEIPYRAL